MLALVSRPAFNPNDFSVRVSRDEWNKLVTDPRHPLLDKAIQAQLAPGSTFKIIMSLAGLENGIAQNMTVNCTGGAIFYGRYFACDHHHGLVDILHAIPKSCDTFYYTLAERLGIEKIAYWAHKVGIGQKTGIDLPGEVSGTMPSEEWKLKTFHEKWYAGEVISVGIGQGAVAISPIQLVRAIAGIASGGVFKRPHVVEADQLTPEFRQALDDSYPGSGDVSFPIDPAIWETITDGMAGALDASMGGTAFAAHLDNIDFAGKTGTAQVVNHSAGALVVSKDVATRANSWFVGMSPRRNPDIAVVVLTEHGGWGSASAPVAAQIVEAFVDKQRRLDNNLQEAKVPEKVEVGAVWSEPPDGTPAQGYHRIRQGRCPGYERWPLHGAGAAGQQPGQLWRSRQLADTSTDRTTRRTMRRFISFRDFDWLLLAMVLLLSVISILEIYSATLHTKFVGFETKQIFWLIGGLAAMFLFSLINYHRLLEAVHWVYGFCLVSLVAVLIFGTKVMGGRRWIKLPGGIHFQPSEWVKVVLIVAMARYFAGLAGRDLTWSDIFKAFLLVGLPMLLVLKQPDLGTSLTYVPVLIIGLFLGGLEWKKGVILVVAGLVLVVPVWAQGAQALPEAAAHQLPES